VCAQQLSAEDLIKVRLTYHTETPTTEAALFISRMGTKAPYVEDVHILIPREKAFSGLNTYLPAFEVLKAQKIVPESSLLVAYAFADEDDQILAYRI